MIDPDAHLLIVDDDERIRGLLQKFLIRNGFLVSAARDAVHAPSAIRRQLHGFGARKHHAKGECIEVLLLGKPVALFDNFLVHESDLTGRSAKGKQSDPCPYRQGLPY